MIRTLFFIFLFTSSQLSICQQFEINWSPEYKYSNNSYHAKIIGANDSLLYALSVEDKTFGEPEYYLETYSLPSLELFSNQLLEIPALYGTEPILENVILLENKIYLFVTELDLIGKTNVAFAYSLNTDGSINQAPVKLGSAEFLSKKDAGQYVFQLTPDSSRVLVYFEPPFEKYGNEKFFFSAWNGNMEMEWQKEVELPFTDLSFTISKCELTINNDLFLMSEAGAEKGNRTGITGYSYTVMAYYNEANIIKEYEINLGKQYITSASFITDYDGDLVVAGFYSNDKRFSIAGSFYLKIDAETRSIQSMAMKDFSSEVMSQLQQGNDGELEEYYLDEVLLLNDGSIRLIGEQYYEYITQYQDFQTGMIRTERNYIFGPIIVVAINTKGEIAWDSAILKKQHSTNDSGYYSGYAAFVKADILWLLYNDNPKNIGEVKLKEMNNPSKADAVMVKLTNDGNNSSNIIFNSKDLETTLRPLVHWPLTNSEWLILGRKGKGYQFGLIVP